MPYKTIEAVEQALSAEFSLPTYTKPGTQFTYVPWTASKRLLDEVFGVFGWSTTEPHVTFAPIIKDSATGVYTVSMALIVRVTDDGNVIEKVLPCIGQAVSYGTDDNAAKSALSDALSKGVKMLGDAFGFSLYEKKGNQRQDTVTSATVNTNQRTTQRQSNEPIVIRNDGPVTDAQAGMLKRLQYGGDISGLTKRTASELISRLKSEQAEPVF